MQLRINILFICLSISFYATSIDQYTNPVILPSNYSMSSTADPFVFKDNNGVYYCYVTGKGFPAFVSKDLVKWVKASSNPFPSANYKWALSNHWAPEVVKVRNLYYMHYTGKDADGFMKIGLAKSISPLGPFSDVSETAFYSRKNKSIIDSHIFFDDDGKAYMYFANDMSTNTIPGTSKKRSEIWVIEIKPDLSDTIGPAKLLFYPTQPWEYNPSNNDFWNEAPAMIKHNGLYYLMYSANCYCSNYSIGYAISKSPLGPFIKYSQNPILAGVSSYVSGPGHNSVVLSPDNSEMICVYHSHIDLVEKGGKRKVNIDRMGFRDNGVLYINGPTYTAQNYPSTGATSVNTVSEAKKELAISYLSSSDEIKIEVPLFSQELVIYNAIGRQISTVELSESQSGIMLSVQHFSKGIYIVRLQNKFLPGISGKFLIN